MVVIDNFDIGQSRDSLYEEGDINDTIPPPLPPPDDKMVGDDPGNGIYW